jgi:hypothetical protein
MFWNILTAISDALKVTGIAEWVIAKLKTRKEAQTDADATPLTPDEEGDNLLRKGGRIWPKMRLRDRIDATIAHEFEELHADGKHAKAVKNAATTKLPISDEGRRLNRARAR